LFINIPSFDNETISILSSNIFLYFIPIIYIILNLKKPYKRLKKLLFEGNKFKINIIHYIIINFSLMALSISSIYIIFTLFYLLLPENISNTLIKEFLNDELLSENMANSIFYHIITITSIVLIAPVCEEIIFRGLIFNRLKTKFNFTFSIIISSIIFGLLHSIDFIGATIFAISMTFIYLKTKKLIIPILLHSFYNTICLLFSYIDKSDDPLPTMNELLNVNSIILSSGVFLISILVLLFIFKSIHKKSKLINNNL
jgi:membrane protease YdiL (CAAX protease family)